MRLSVHCLQQKFRGQIRCHACDEIFMTANLNVLEHFLVFEQIGKRYSLLSVVAMVVMCLGLVLFNLADVSVMPNMNHTGMSML